MKKIFVYIIVLGLMLNLAFALGVERTISNNQVTLKITGYSDRFGGIISETLPTGYSPTGIQNFNVGVSGSASGKLEGQLYEIAFISEINPATITYGISGSGSGTISGSYAYEDGNIGVISGNSQLGSGIACTYETICDETDSCSNTRDTDGTICGTNQLCVNGVCTTQQTSNQITCWKKVNSVCSSYQVVASNCGQDYATKEVCEGVKTCSEFIKNLPTKIGMEADCDAGFVMIGLLLIIGLIAFLVLKGVFK